MDSLLERLSLCGFQNSKSIECLRSKFNSDPSNPLLLWLSQNLLLNKQEDATGSMRLLIPQNSVKQSSDLKSMKAEIGDSQEQLKALLAAVSGRSELMLSAEGIASKSTVDLAVREEIVAERVSQQSGALDLALQDTSAKIGDMASQMKQKQDWLLSLTKLQRYRRADSAFGQELSR